MEPLRAWVESVMKTSREIYNVDPVVFLGIYLASVPVFYYSLLRTIRALARRQGKEATRWSTVFLCAVVAPFLYVLFFGRNLPWWVYAIIAALVAQGAVSLVRKRRSASTGGENRD